VAIGAGGLELDSEVILAPFFGLNFVRRIGLESRSRALRFDGFLVYARQL
jgi:hypothetical protein